MTTEIQLTRATSEDEKRPDPEVVARPKRRTFTAEYRMSILREADACTEKGQIGALLRREGLYASHLTDWRKQRDRGALAGLSAARGRKPKYSEAEREMQKLRSENEKLKKELSAANLVIDVQKKRLGALGDRPRERGDGERAMITASVAKLKPEVGTAAACRHLGVPRANVYRWRKPQVKVAPRKERSSTRALTPPERIAVLDMLHSERFADDSPAQVYASLLDEGTYLASERTMYRILAANNEVRERRNQLRRPNYAKPELLATAPNELWSWDITKLLGPQKWTYYYLYVMLDVFSRYVVGWMLAHRESAELAKRFIAETIAKQNIPDDNTLTIHADRGSSMTSKPVAFLMADLGITKSHSRPHVSNDNPFSESQFRTMKYRPEFPQRFGCIQDGRGFCCGFFNWYNNEHHHSGIGLHTPASVHYGTAAANSRAAGCSACQRIRRPSRTVRSRQSNAASAAHGRVDQLASKGGGESSVISDPRCLKGVDRRRNSNAVADYPDRRRIFSGQPFCLRARALTPLSNK